MAEYVLDDMHTPEFKALDSFTQGYIQAMFFTNESNIGMEEFFTEESQHFISEGQADGDLPFDAGFSDIHPESLAIIIAECKAFQDDNADLLRLATDSIGYDLERAGMDFWFTRCGHGVGYWDRNELGDELGEDLSDAARAIGERWVSFDADPDSPTGYGYVHIC